MQEIIHLIYIFLEAFGRALGEAFESAAVDRRRDSEKRLAAFRKAREVFEWSALTNYNSDDKHGFRKQRHDYIRWVNTMRPTLGKELIASLIELLHNDVRRWVDIDKGNGDEVRKYLDTRLRVRTILKREIGKLERCLL